MTPLPDSSPEADIFAFGKVVNLDDPAVYGVQFFLDPDGTIQVRVPAGRYSVTGSIFHDDWFAGTSRMVLAGDPDVPVTTDTSVVFDGAAATPVTMTVDGVATEAVAVGVYYEQSGRRGDGWSDFAFSWGENARTWSTFATPMDEPELGDFQAYTVAGLRAPGDGPSPFLYDLIVPHDSGLPAELSHQVTAAEQATLARIDQRFHRLDREFTVTDHKRYGVAPSGALISETATHDLSGNRIDYLSPGFSWVDEAFYDGVVTQEGPRRYEPGSRQEKVWVRQPLRPDWYDDPAPVVSSCAPAPVSRTAGNLHVELVDLADGTTGSSASAASTAGGSTPPGCSPSTGTGSRWASTRSRSAISQSQRRWAITGSSTISMPARCCRSRPGCGPRGRSARPARPAATAAAGSNRPSSAPTWADRGLGGSGSGSAHSITSYPVICSLSPRTARP